MISDKINGERMLHSYVCKHVYNIFIASEAMLTLGWLRISAIGK